MIRDSKESKWHGALRCLSRKTVRIEESGNFAYASARRSSKRVERPTRELIAKDWKNRSSRGDLGNRIIGSLPSRITHPAGFVRLVHTPAQCRLPLLS